MASVTIPLVKSMSSTRVEKRILASGNSEEKIPRIGFVRTFRSEREAVNAANDLVRNWGWSAETVYSPGNALCYADAYVQTTNGSINYETLTVKSTNNNSF